MGRERRRKTYWVERRQTNNTVRCMQRKILYANENKSVKPAPFLLTKNIKKKTSQRVVKSKIGIYI